MEIPNIQFIKQCKLYDIDINGITVEFYMYSIYKNATFHTVFVYPEADGFRPTYHKLAEYVIMLDSANLCGNEIFIMANTVMNYILYDMIQVGRVSYNTFKFFGKENAIFIGAISMALWRYLGSHKTLRKNIYQLYKATK